MLHESPAPAKILLVDDKPANLLALRAVLAPAELSSPHAICAGALGGLRLLIVEDDDDGREMIQHVLRSSGACVTAVSTAEAALDVLQGENFDVLVSDIGLPAMDGYALVERARAGAPAAERLPAIALTAYVSRDDRGRALAAGFDAHVPKPVEATALVSAIAAAARSPRPAMDSAP